MKKIFCCVTLLFIVLGCEQDNPDAQPAPDNYEQEAQQDTIVADGNKHQKTPMDAPVPGKPITNSIGMKLVYIPHGEFMMGSPSSELDRYPDEGPVHRVTITRGFYMSSTEVTQAQYRSIMGTSPSYFEGDDNPVEKVSWNDAVEFCKKLSEKERKTYRLPTEAEWEYACRGKTTTPFYTGETISTDQANYNGKYVYGNGTKGIYRVKTIPAGTFSPNEFGLYDMHGNVWEWCKDKFNSDYYSIRPATDPQGPSTGRYRMLRGGSWLNEPWGCRSASRGRWAPVSAHSVLGFRCALNSQ